MATPAELSKQLYKALKSDRTIMLGLADRLDESQPMTALFDDDRPHGPLWIFASSDVELVRQLQGSAAAVAHFVGKGHDLFATVRGTLAVANDREVIDRLWNPLIAAWYPDGKTDAKLRLLRFDLSDAQVWLNENSVFSLVKVMLGRDPKEEYKEKTGHVVLS